MAKKTIQIGTNPDDNTGDSLHVAGNKINENFDELYIENQNLNNTANSLATLVANLDLKISNSINFVEEIITTDVVASLADNEVKIYQSNSDTPIKVNINNNIHTLIDIGDSIQIKRINGNIRIIGSYASNSNSVVIDNNVAPNFTTNPILVASSLNEGGVITATNAFASGVPTPNITYEFRREGVIETLPYTITTLDVQENAMFTYRAIATNIVGQVTADSNVITATEQPVIEVAPSFTSDPLITSNGTAIGSQYTVQNEGAAAGVPAPTLSIQWYRGTTAISGANGLNYISVVEDAEQLIKARVTATNSAGAAFKDSNEILSDDTAARAPAITYTPPMAAGTVLNFDWGVPDNPNGYTVEYWLSIKGPQTKLTSAETSYTVQAADLGTGDADTIFIRNKFVLPDFSKINGPSSNLVSLVPDPVNIVSDGAGALGLTENGATITDVDGAALITRTGGNIWNSGLKLGSEAITTDRWIDFDVTLREPDANSSGQFAIKFEFAGQPYPQSYIVANMDGSGLQYIHENGGFSKFAGVEIVQNGNGSIRVSGRSRADAPHEAGQWQITVGPNASVDGQGVIAETISVTQGALDTAPETLGSATVALVSQLTGGSELIEFRMSDMFSDDGGAVNLTLSATGLPIGTTYRRTGSGQIVITIPPDQMPANGEYPFTITADDGVNTLATHNAFLIVGASS